MKKRYSDEQIIAFLKEAESGVSVKELCRRHGFSDASFYTWRSKSGGMDVSDAKRALEAENAKLKGDVDLGAPARCEAPADRTGQAESERLHRIVQQSLPG